jgi:hypothetical protein
VCYLKNSNIKRCQYATKTDIPQRCDTLQFVGWITTFWRNMFTSSGLTVQAGTLRKYVKRIRMDNSCRPNEVREKENRAHLPHHTSAERRQKQSLAFFTFWQEMGACGELHVSATSLPLMNRFPFDRMLVKPSCTWC